MSDKGRLASTMCNINNIPGKGVIHNHRTKNHTNCGVSIRIKTITISWHTRNDLTESQKERLCKRCFS